MTNVIFLKQLIAKSDYSEQQLASQLGLSTATLLKKLNNSQEFKASEVEKLAVLLDLSYEQSTTAFFCSCY